MTTTPLHIALNGASGRMGQRIAALADADPQIRVVRRFDTQIPDDSAPSSESADGALPIEVLIDFSSPAGTKAALALAREHRAALLIGTTGLDEETLAEIRETAQTISVMLAPNTSLGVAVLRHVAREAARLLPEHDLDIIEMHHSAKLDSPSGTARSLATALADAGRPVAANRIHAIRAGEIVGEHTVQLAGAGEVLRLVHAAMSRDLFASGALRAARWLRGRPAGLYTIEHALGLVPA